MNLSELLFIITILLGLGITLLKLYNLFTACKLYEMKISILLFIGFVMSWFLNFSIFMANPEVIYSILFKFLNMFFILNVLFLIVEIIINMGFANKKQIESYNPRQGQPFEASYFKK